MKELIFTVVLALANIAGIAQIAQGTNIHKILLSTAKTSTLTFPKPIAFIDKGTNDILVQKVTTAENILLVKARVPHFNETNITVITNDGSLFSCVVKYDSTPKVFNYTLAYDNLNQPDVLNDRSVFTPKVNDYAKVAAVSKRSISGIKDTKSRMNATVNGIYIKDGVLFFRITLTNRSSIDYDIDLLRVFITNQAKVKRTPIQEQDQEPLLINGNIKQVKAKEKNVVVIALPKFTISSEKILSIQIIERNGGRHLKLNVKSSKLMKAKSL